MPAQDQEYPQFAEGQLPPIKEMEEEEKEDGAVAIQKKPSAARTDTEGATPMQAMQQKRKGFNQFHNEEEI